jgi:hypothetical protein
MHQICQPNQLPMLSPVLLLSLLPSTIDTAETTVAIAITAAAAANGTTAIAVAACCHCC